MVIGILEVGVAFRDLLTVSNAAKEGVRVMAAMGDDPLSDCVVLTKTSFGTGVGVWAGRPSHDRDLLQTSSPMEPPAHDNNVYSLPVGADHSVCTEWSPNPMDIDSLDWSPLLRNVKIGPDDELDIAGVRITFHPQLDYRVPTLLPVRSSWTKQRCRASSQREYAS